jgi:hypothetical protein
VDEGRGMRGFEESEKNKVWNPRVIECGGGEMKVAVGIWK